MRGAKGLEGPLRSLEHGKLTIGPIPGPDPVTVPHGERIGSGPAPGRAVSGRPLCNIRNIRLSEGQH